MIQVFNTQLTPTEHPLFEIAHVHRLDVPDEQQQSKPHATVHVREPEIRIREIQTDTCIYISFVEAERLGSLLFFAPIVPPNEQQVGAMLLTQKSTTIALPRRYLKDLHGALFKILKESIS